VKIVDEDTLYNIIRENLRVLFIRFFSEAQLQITVQNFFGNQFTPLEWFLVPPSAVAEAVDLIKSGDITNYRYDRATAKFTPNNLVQNEGQTVPQKPFDGLSSY